MSQPLRQSDYGLKVAHAQRLPVHTVEKLWAVPGNGFVCIASLQKGGYVSLTCSTTKRALKQGVATITLSDASTGAPRVERLIVGIAPDDATKAYIHTGPTTIAAPVVGNVFTHRDSATQPPDRITLR